MNQQGLDSTAGPFPEVTGLRLLQELGRSPKGITYKARRLVEQDVVVAKILRSSRCEKRFISELPRKAESSFVLEHKGLVRSLGCVEEKGRLILLMDYAPGESLAKLLQSGQPMALPRALLIGLQCANALRYAALHQLHHGRLHPSDLILGEDHARITGVGLGKRPEHAAWAEPEAPPFEPLIYTAPEAMPSRPFPDSAAAQAAVDIYSLGAMLFHALTGTPPFRGADEAALENERKFIAAAVVWPADRKAGLPAGLIALLEKMLAPDSKERPGYDELVGTLAEGLSATDKEDAARWQRPGRVEESKRLVALSLAKPVAAGITPAHRAAGPSGAAAAVAGAPQWGYALPQPAKSSLGSRIYNAVLLGLTALVFIIAVVLAAKIFVFDALKQAAIGAAGVPPAASPESETPAPPAKAVGTPALPAKTAETPAAHALPKPVTELERKAEEYAAATTQLEVIQGMLARKEVQQSAGLLKVLKEEIVEKAGRETPTGVKALVLAKEIEGTLALAPLTPAVPPVAVEPLPVIPGVGRAGPGLTEKQPPAPEATSQPPTPPAKATETAPPVTPPAKTAEAPPAPTPPSNPPEQKTEPAAKPGPLKNLMAKARAFQYVELGGDLAKLGATLSGEEKNAVEVYGGLAKREQELFKRCRKWLVDEIQRRPRHDSPLQVFPRKNEPGDDIVDFDETGLKISEKRPTGTNQRILPWEKTPSAQAFALLQLTSDKNSVEDQLGLAVFAFSRGLKPETDAELAAARAIPGGREKTEGVEGQIKQLSKHLEPPAEPEKGGAGGQTGTK